MVQIGQAAPSFEGEAFWNNEIKKFRLSDVRGKFVVLLFYPGDFTFICPTELEEAAAHYTEFQKHNAEIVSISTDSVWVHKAWHDQSPAIKKVDFAMLADPTGQICRAYETYLDNVGVSLRGTFIIDPDGILRVKDIHDNSVGRSTAEILRRLQAIKFVREHPGNVCPANWKPGEKTLQPGLNLVGKI